MLSPKLLEQERTALAEQVCMVTAGLGASLKQGGHLHDSGTGRNSPDDHYGHIFTAVALYSQPDAGDWHQPLIHWLNLMPNQRGHEPFNRLGLGLLDCYLSADSSSAQSLQLVREGIGHCPLNRHYISNNWSLLATAVHISLSQSDRQQQRWLRRLLRQSARWTTPAGGFIDFPLRPTRFVGATPAAYHCKYLLSLWLAYCQQPDRRLADRLCAGLDWLNVLQTDGGYCGGFGRSNHALFGDACLLTVLHGLLVTPKVLATDHAERLLRTARNLRTRLAAQQRADGLLWLTPAHASGEAGGWDQYMFLTVYNAWYAGLLSAVLRGHRWLNVKSAMTKALTLSLPGGHGSLRSTDDLLADNDAGLLRFHAADVDLLISTHGQPVQGFNATTIDLRQAALLPFHLEYRGQPLIPPPSRFGLDQLSAEPWRAGLVPVVEHAGCFYGMGRLQAVSSVSTARSLQLEGTGAPVALHRILQGGMIERLRDALDWRFLGGRLARRQSVQPRVLRHHRWHLVLEINTDSKMLTAHLTLFGCPHSQARLINPLGHAFLELSSADVVVENLSDTVSGEWLTGSVASSLGTARARCLPPFSWPGSDCTLSWRWCYQPSEC